MTDEFFTGYSEQSDDELLHLASARHSLTSEASTALDAELRRRNLTDSDRIQHQRFVKRQEWREAKTHRRKVFGPFEFQLSWRDLAWAFGAFSLISFTYIALPSRYHVKPEWQDPVVIVMITSVIIAIASRSVFWRKFAFWISLALSSALHLVVVHSLTQRISDLSRAAAKGASVLGFLLFLAIYTLVLKLQRNFYAKDVSDNS